MEAKEGRSIQGGESVNNPAIVTDTCGCTVEVFLTPVEPGKSDFNVKVTRCALHQAAGDLLAYAEMSEAAGEYYREGSGFTMEMCLAVLTRHGYVPAEPTLPGLGLGRWVREFRTAAIAKAKGRA